MSRPTTGSGLDHTELPQFFSEFAGTEMVDLFVGESKKLFRVHKGLLCNTVPYFNKMFNSGFEEGRNSFATFPEDNEESFDLLIGWIYSGSVPNLQITFRPEPTPNIYSWDPIKCYSLAEKYCLPQLMDLIISTWQNAQEESPDLVNLDQTLEAYKLTSENSTLRSYCIDSIVYDCLQCDKSEIPKSVISSFVKDMMKRNDEVGVDFVFLLRMRATLPRPIEDPREAPRCTYHWHRDEEDCPCKPKF